MSEHPPPIVFPSGRSRPGCLELSCLELSCTPMYDRETTAISANQFARIDSQEKPYFYRFNPFSTFIRTNRPTSPFANLSASDSPKFLGVWLYVLEKSKWGLSNGGLRPLSAICAQSSIIVHFCGLFGPLSKGNFRRKMTTIVGNRGQLWTSALSPHLESPHLDFPECWKGKRRAYSQEVGPKRNANRFVRIVQLRLEVLRRAALLCFLRIFCSLLRSLTFFCIRPRFGEFHAWLA